MVKIIPLLLVSMLVYNLVSGSENEQLDKVFTLSKKFQELFFSPENSQSVYNMREVFFPSSNYRFWKPDNIIIIDIDICLNIDSCLEIEKTTNFTTRCTVYRWSNSYFLNLIDVSQLHYFELLTTVTLFGTIARSHTERLINITLNVSCDGLDMILDDTTISQAQVQFLSWVSMYVYR